MSILAQLNLKNDALRRRFDSLKYDIKKIEEGETSPCLSSLTYLISFYQLSMMYRYENWPIRNTSSLAHNSIYFFSFYNPSYRGCYRSAVWSYTFHFTFILE